MKDFVHNRQNLSEAMQQVYRRLNAEYFDGQLPAVDITIEHSLGPVHALVDLSDERPRIRLHAALVGQVFSSEGPGWTWAPFTPLVMLHEAIHIRVGPAGGPHHGRRFVRDVNRVARAAGLPEIPVRSMLFSHDVPGAAFWPFQQLLSSGAWEHADEYRRVVREIERSTLSTIRENIDVYQRTVAGADVDHLTAIHRGLGPLFARAPWRWLIPSDARLAAARAYTLISRFLPAPAMVPAIGCSQEGDTNDSHD